METVNFIPDNFRNDLAMSPWHLVELGDNTDIAWVKWQQIFLGIVGNHAPCKRRRVRNVTSPWITSDVKKLMFQRDKFNKVVSRFPTEANWSHCRYIKNKFSYEIRNTKISYYNTLFQEISTNIKNTWRGIIKLMGKEPSSTKIFQLQIRENQIRDPNDIANRLNSHFSQIGPSLSSAVKETSSKFTELTTVQNFLQRCFKSKYISYQILTYITYKKR